MTDIDIKPTTQKELYILEDKDYVMATLIQKLINAINKLTGAMR
ncbi:hypothetical protein LCGC14_2685060 [marine sediment metagenome]|uniref:Uncharacterized protein n=1 Tax=marine sediment metagenome TaxID=412755 RepID=A0A0F8ZK73_9ZZZZ